MMTHSFALHTQWLSALIDGEHSLDAEGVPLSLEVRKTLYYYTLTRQVVRGEPCLVERHHQHQQRWLELWARIDAHTQQNESI